ncbi:uncharacterized protein LOC133726655 [Rosa rugosa]|uniref:uncharacterized protein LOC133726655 n=1 Tax=Rosa rugosa TaxID=74645 RepID=UPI002B403942|nr:uncharacterized protein LOC133726655 [Rosa rugosa]
MKRLMIEHTEAHPTSALVALVPYIYGETALLFTSEHWEMMDDILRTEFFLAPHAAVLEGSHGLLTGTELQEYWDKRKISSSDLPSSRVRDVVARGMVYVCFIRFFFISAVNFSLIVRTFFFWGFEYVCFYLCEAYESPNLPLEDLIDYLLLLFYCKQSLL